MPKSEEVFNKTIKYYPISETTSLTSGTIRLSIPSIPDLSVTVDDGQPLHEPCRITVTIPWLKDLNSIFPPSISTAGLTLSLIHI